MDATFSVADIEAVYEHICAKSVNIVQPLREMPYGMEFYIADPDGYIFAFVGQK